MKILLADDYEDLRGLLSDTLRSQGYRVVEAADGAEALQACWDAADPPDVLITDIEMPGMDGFELADRLRSQYPALRVIYMSAGGYALPVLPKDWVTKVLIDAPRGVEALINEVDTVLGGGAEDRPIGPASAPWRRGARPASMRFSGGM